MTRDISALIKVFCLNLALALLLSSSARADFYYETFDGPLNPGIWSLSTGGNDWLVSGGKLKITRTNSTNGSLAFVPQLIGDFDVQFDYELFWANTYAYGDRIHLGLATDTPTHSYIVGHTQEGNIHGVAVDPSARYGWGPNAPVGKMRVSRTGSDIRMQYFSAGNWITLQTGTDSRDMWLKVDNYIHNSFTAGSRVEIDNFNITASQFSSVPEPSGLGILAFTALTAVTFRLRRRRN